MWKAEVKRNLKLFFRAGLPYTLVGAFIILSGIFVLKSASQAAIIRPLRFSSGWAFYGLFTSPCFANGFAGSTLRRSLNRPKSVVSRTGNGTSERPNWHNSSVVTISRNIAVICVYQMIFKDTKSP